MATTKVDIGLIDASGTASSGTFLRGDGAWQAAGGGKVLQVVTATTAAIVATTSTSFVTSGLTASITPAATANKILVMTSQMFRSTKTTGSSASTVAAGHAALMRGAYDGTQLTEHFFSVVDTPSNTATGINVSHTTAMIWLDSPSTTSSQAYTVAMKSLSTNWTLRVNEDYDSTGDLDAGSIVLMEIDGS